MRIRGTLLLVAAALMVACEADSPVAVDTDDRLQAPVAMAMSENAAIVINQDTGLCGMPGADADGNLTFGGIGVINRIVENNNSVKLDCKGTDITNLSGSGQSFRDFGCGIPAPSGGSVFTTDTHATVSASGQATLSCTFKK